jgi:hypothetical protein
MQFEHKKFGKCELKEINQKMMEDFHRDMIGKDKMPLSVWRGDSVRAAVKQEFMVEPKWTVEDVDNAKPGHIIWLADCIAEMMREALSIDPLS